MDFTVDKGPEKGSQNGVLRRPFPGGGLERPLGEYDPLGGSPLLFPFHRRSTENEKGARPYTS